MTRELIYNAFLHLTPNHHSHGYWRTPEGSVQYGYNKLESYVDVVRTLERGRFDSLFIADVVGVYDLDFGDGTASVRAGSQFPEPDPVTIASALGLVTEHLGIAVTSNIIQAHPFSFARQLSSIDEFTGGRAAWNIVTSYLSNGFRNYGHDTIVSHDERYRWAQEYVDVTYKLWEHSWEDGAVLHDPSTNRFFDPDKIHRINHHGDYYDVEGPHVVEPSPQRTPVLFQAGNSPAGREFAVRNAEVTFLPSNTPDAAKRDIARLDDLARHRDDQPPLLNGESLVEIGLGVQMQGLASLRPQSPVGVQRARQRHRQRTLATAKRARPGEATLIGVRDLSAHALDHGGCGRVADVAGEGVGSADVRVDADRALVLAGDLNDVRESLLLLFSHRRA
jgi:alkanesulfonate monooxygenase SsuD/methylene tetrahydromethanopterin reductase-like flavin-dependent oxidoreductase (luciferase family)